MAKSSTVEDDLFPELTVDKPKQLRGTQPDGSYVDCKGEVRPPKKPRRVPYPEPEDKQAEGNQELVESPDGSLSFLAVRLGDVDYRKSGTVERKRQQLRYRVTEMYAGRPRPYYSWDELEQLRRGEMSR
jgi:hypothetical protein